MKNYKLILFMLSLKIFMIINLLRVKLWIKFKKYSHPKMEIFF